MSPTWAGTAREVAGNRTFLRHDGARSDTARSPAVQTTFRGWRRGTIDTAGRHGSGRRTTGRVVNQTADFPELISDALGVSSRIGSAEARSVITIDRLVFLSWPDLQPALNTSRRSVARWAVGRVTDAYNSGELDGLLAGSQTVAGAAASLGLDGVDDWQVTRFGPRALEMLLEAILVLLAMPDRPVRHQSPRPEGR